MRLILAVAVEEINLEDSEKIENASCVTLIQLSLN